MRDQLKLLLRVYVEGEPLIVDPVKRLREAFPPMEFNSDFIILRSLLLIGFLARKNPCDQLDASHILDILMSKSDLIEDEHDDNTYSSIMYSSFKIFPIFSTNIVRLLSEMLSNIGDRNRMIMMRRIVRYLGLIRCAVDLFYEPKNFSQFGGIVGDRLCEFWQKKGDIGLFELVLFSQKSIEQAQQISLTREVFHLNAGCSWDLFLRPFLLALNSKELSEEICNLSEFIYWFSVSSVFERGQSAVMEWLIRAFCLMRHIEFDIHVINLDSKISQFLWGYQDFTYRELFRSIAMSSDQSKEDLLLGKLFSHLDVVALCMSEFMDMNEAAERFCGFVNESKYFVKEISK